MRALVIASMLLVGACAASGPERVVEERVTDQPAPRGPARLQRTMLSGHNQLRASLNLPSLAWSDRLAADAQVYADELARTGRFEHSEQPRGTLPGGEGENLWMGTREAYRFEEMIGHWAAEKRFYNGLPVPQSSTSGKFGDVAHFTQMTWRASTQVGCAIASNTHDDYVVCRYAPAGNVVGERPF